MEVSGNAGLSTDVVWYIMPTVNPDGIWNIVIKRFLSRWFQILDKGYEYTHVTDRLWRKTRSKSWSFCRGVDPNRNFAFKVGYFSIFIPFLSIIF